MTEGVVAKWHKKIGDTVNEGDLLAEIETDKATMEFEAFPGQEGKLLYIGTGEGETAPVDTVLAILGDEGEDIEALKAAMLLLQWLQQKKLQPRQPFLHQQLLLLLLQRRHPLQHLLLLTRHK